MARFGRFILALAIVLGLILGCGAPSPTPSPTPTPTPTPTPSPTPTPTPTPTPEVKKFPIKLVDQLGREVVIEDEPLRIISLAPSNTEILFALGLGERVVGVTEFCNYPPEALEKEKIGGFSNPSIEKIIALEPDIVLATSIHRKTVIPELEKRGIKVFALAPKNMDEIFEGIELCGLLFGVERRALLLVKEMRGVIKEVRDRVKGREKKKVFYLTWHEPIWTSGSGTFAHELIEIAGGENIFGDKKGWIMVTLEEVIERDPEVIVASTGHGEARDLPFNWAKTDERLSAISARKEGRIYQIDADLITRPGPRIVEALKLLSEMIHPEAWK